MIKTFLSQKKAKWDSGSRQASNLVHRGKELAV